MHVRQSFGIVVFLLVSLSCSFVQNMEWPGGNPSSAGEIDRRVLLNEILFLPADGGAAFLELKGVEKRASLAGLYLLNEKEERYTLPEGLPALAPDHFLLFIFDGGIGWKAKLFMLTALLTSTLNQDFLNCMPPMAPCLIG
ncbi:MAG: hypothetical protein A2Z03_03780 [Chloroflexi bacterium RBG_16_56_8]|nr:MAG: hypothetical protein A2Z03_03780 [Chloroflexi bacterium RBG_16_56_8]